LGPGSFIDTTGVIAYDKIGDIKIDMSLEYRFNLVSIIDLGLFIDASNIWYMVGNGLVKESPAVFNVNRFMSEIALGVGAGVRLNFNFFLIRFDFGYRARDPGVPLGERWFWQPKDIYNATNGSAPNYKRGGVLFNLAIGYPF
jgi:outer membrane protein assembly factor BamA